MIEFTEFPKIPRLFRDIVITEKIDGTNGAVGIEFGTLEDDFFLPSCFDEATQIDRGGFEVNGRHNVARVYAQSRKRVITPKTDNHGFARWVWDNAESLVADLGPGLHFGEWWGSGIGRAYGMPKGEKRFSLFNTKRWGNVDFKTAGLGVVPVLYTGPFSTTEVNNQLLMLSLDGSAAAPGFTNPEGIVIYHTAGNLMFKVTIKGDETPKSKAVTTDTGFVMMQGDRVLTDSLRQDGARGAGMTFGEYVGLEGLT